MNKDRIYLVGAILSILVISIVVIRTHPVNPNANYIGPEGEYVPPSKIDSKYDAQGATYVSMVNSSEMSCPGVSSNQNSTIGTPINTKGAYAGMKGTPLFSYYLFTAEELGKADKISDPIGALGLQGDIKYKTIAEINGSRTSTTYADGTYEIIAPFDYEFLDYYNMLDTKITIVNFTGNLKIEINNYSNLWCAGRPGTVTIEPGVSKEISWENHDGHHQTFIGSSDRCKISSGKAGSLLAYGNDNTAISIYYKDASGSWKDATWDNIYPRSK